jgi:hypothetical protein
MRRKLCDILLATKVLPADQGRQRQTRSPGGTDNRRSLSGEAHSLHMSNIVTELPDDTCNALICRVENGSRVMLDVVWIPSHGLQRYSMLGNNAARTVHDRCPGRVPALIDAEPTRVRHPVAVSPWSRRLS